MTMRFIFLSILLVAACHNEPDTICTEEQTNFYQACIDVGCHAAITESESGTDTTDTACIVSCACEGGGTVTAPKED